MPQDRLGRVFPSMSPLAVRLAGFALSACFAVATASLAGCGGGAGKSNTSGSCTEDSDCAGGQMCYQGKCQSGQVPRACQADGDCPVGERCQDGRCAPSADGGGVECRTSDDCPSGTCQMGACRGGRDVPNGGACQGNNDCESGLCTDGTCIGVDLPPGSCADDSDCPTGTCSAGVCRGTGEVPNGGGCVGNADCQSGLCQNGTCQAPGPGVMCSTDADCASGSSCQNGTCLGSGQVPNGSPCTGNADCQSGLCQNGLCAAPGPGRMCSSNSDCAQGATCQNGICQGTGQVPNGGNCTGNADCQSGFCDQGTCRPNGPGGSCQTNGDCALGASCVNGVCQGSGQVPNGGVCTGNNDCQSQLCSGGFCVAPQPGPMCTDNSVCAAGSTCVNGLCQGNGQVPNGSGCTGNSDCQSGLCISGTCTAVTPGPMCTDNSACAVGATCTNGVCQGNGQVPNGSGCTGNADCLTRFCNNGSCDDPPPGPGTGSSSNGAGTTNPFPPPGTGNSNNVITDPSGNIVLPPPQQAQTSTYVWIANDFISGNTLSATVSKIDARTRIEVARYRVGLSTVANNRPSRTAIDLRGNAYVASRALGPSTGCVAFDCYADQGSVTKIANNLVDCVDRNGNGVIDTSTGPGDVKAYGEDECVLWSVPVGPPGAWPRALAVGLDYSATPVFLDGIPWVGTYFDREATTGLNPNGDHCYGVGRVYKLNPDTGAVLNSLNIPVNPYGLSVDGNARMWATADFYSGNGGGQSDNFRGAMTVIDLQTETVLRHATNSQTARCAGGGGGAVQGFIIKPRVAQTNSNSEAGTPCRGGYGIAVDKLGRVWTAGWSCLAVWRFTPDATDPTTGTFSSLDISANGGNTRGIAIDGASPANAWVVQDANPSRLSRIRTDQAALSVLSTRTFANTSSGIGIQSDLDGFMWIVNQGSNNATRFDFPNNTFALAPIDVNGNAVALVAPYTYSDFTGFALRTFTRPNGSYSLIYQGCPQAGTTDWGTITVTGQTPANTEVEIRVRTADTQPGLSTAAYSNPVPITLGQAVDLNALGAGTGTFLQIELILISTDNASTPSISGVTVSWTCPPGPCTDPSQCPGGQICTNSSCAPCTDSTQCPSGQVCLNGTCAPPPPPSPCQTAADCTGGQVCDASVCSPCVARTADQCPGGQVCINGSCAPPPPPAPCTTGADCQGGQICNAQTCGPCTDTTQCPSGQACVNGSCVAQPPPTPCTANSDCTAGRICQAGSCVPCTTSAQCTGGLSCINGGCATPPPPGACATSADCTGGQVCTAGSCAPCTASTQCSGGLSCINGSCTTPPIPGSCRTAGDCPSGQICMGGLCQPCSGTAGGACPQTMTCVNGTCENPQCRVNADCPPSQACMAGLCGPCRANSDCNPGDQCVNGSCTRIRPGG